MKDTHTTRHSTTLSDALWLARSDIRASWLSYPATALVAGFFGTLGALQFYNALDGEANAFTVGLLDFYLLCLVSALGTNLVLNRDYYAGSRMYSFDERLSFLKSLPVGARCAIVARAICALLAVVCSTPVFFAVPYLLSGGLRGAIGIGGYVCFCCFWVGYALVTTGLLYIYGSFAIRWSLARMPLLVAGFLGGCVLIPVAFRYLYGDGITLTVLRLSVDNGLIVAGTSLLAGAIILLASLRLAEVGMRRRDIG